jgi:hypothetical protein
LRIRLAPVLALGFDDKAFRQRGRGVTIRQQLALPPLQLVFQPGPEEASGGGSGSGTADLSGLGSALSGQTYSGELPGAVGVKMGEKVIQFRGAVGFGDQQNNYKVGAGIPF